MLIPSIAGGTKLKAQRRRSLHPSPSPGGRRNPTERSFRSVATVSMFRQRHACITARYLSRHQTLPKWETEASSQHPRFLSHEIGAAHALVESDAHGQGRHRIVTSSKYWRRTRCTKKYNDSGTRNSPEFSTLLFPIRQRIRSAQAPKTRCSSRSGAHKSVERKKVLMFLILAVVLVLLWLGGFFVLHVSSFFIHLLLLFALISIIMNFVGGRQNSLSSIRAHSKRPNPGGSAFCRLSNRSY